MKFAVCVISLGYTRLAGITLYDSKCRDFTETTPRVARELISQGLVKGVKWEKDGFVPDPDFGMDNILVKTGVGKYRPLLNDYPGVPVYSAYTVVRVLETNKGRLYELISNKCQRVKVNEETLLGLSKIGNVGGVIIENDKVTICDGVVIENRVYPDNVELVNLPLNYEGAAVVIDSESEKIAEHYDDADETLTENESDNEESNAIGSLEDVFKDFKADDTVENEEKPSNEKKVTTSPGKNGHKGKNAKTSNMSYK